MDMAVLRLLVDGETWVSTRNQLGKATFRILESFCEDAGLSRLI